MSQAVKCPVCDGFGKVPNPQLDKDYAIGHFYLNQTLPCHGCGGRGWVEIMGDSRYANCGACGRRVKLNKFILGSLHICDSPESES